MSIAVWGAHVRGFRYTPLCKATEQIRLIVLNPGLEEDRLDCNVIHTHLTEPMVYETISYCWGSQDAGTAIMLQGQQVWTSANAAAALAGMRLPTHKRFLWIDALCIDQQNEAERNHQVRMMGNIYARAACNLVYLGEESCAAQKAKFAIQTIYESIKEEVRVRCKEEGEKEDDAYRNVMEIYRTTQDLARPVIALDNSHYDALAMFYCLPWFSRVWVLQEAALATNNRAWWGSCEFDMKEVALGAYWVYNKAFHLPLALVSAPGVQQGRILYDFLDPKMGRYRILPEPRASLATLLELQSNFLASEPRDRVFSMIGLSKFAIFVPPALIPDYGRTVLEVFLHAIWAALQERGVQRILLFVSHPDEDSLYRRDWPSWLPPWDRYFDVSKHARRLYRNRWEHRQTNPIVPEKDPRHPERLKLRGFRISEIAARTPSLDGVTPDEFLTWFNEVEQVTRLSKVGRKTVAYLLMAGKTAERTEATESDAASFNDLTTFLRNNRLSQTPIDEALKEARGAATLDVMRYAIALKNACLHRTVFRTSRGGIGIGPGILQPHDIVVKFAAAFPPYILRPDSYETYRVLGHCYIYEMMENEEVKKCVLTQLCDEEFVLI